MLRTSKRNVLREGFMRPLKKTSRSFMYVTFQAGSTASFLRAFWFLKFVDFHFFFQHSLQLVTFIFTFPTIAENIRLVKVIHLIPSHVT